MQQVALVLDGQLALVLRRLQVQRQALVGDGGVGHQHGPLLAQHLQDKLLPCEIAARRHNVLAQQRSKGVVRGEAVERVTGGAVHLDGLRCGHGAGAGEQRGLAGAHLSLQKRHAPLARVHQLHLGAQQLLPRERVPRLHNVPVLPPHEQRVQRALAGKRVLRHWRLLHEGLEPANVVGGLGQEVVRAPNAQQEVVRVCVLLDQVLPLGHVEQLGAQVPRGGHASEAHLAGHRLQLGRREVAALLELAWDLDGHGRDLGHHS